MTRLTSILCLLVVPVSFSQATEKTVVSLKDFSSTELKSAGIEVPKTTAFRIKALGGGESGWTSRGDEMFAYGWIINAETRNLVWKMDTRNTSRSRDDREFDDVVTLERGSYEIYFTAATFASRSWFSHFSMNIDHRRKPLFGRRDDEGFWSFFKEWWSDDIPKEWEKRSKAWGIELLTDEANASGIKTFTPPKQTPHTLVKATKVGDDQVIRRGFSVTEPITLRIYALGEESRTKELVDYGWIVNTADRSRVWEMHSRNTTRAGGASKNVQYRGEATLKKGEYVLYYITDDSHSDTDWNASPPYDPLNYGITISTLDEKDGKEFRLRPYDEIQNVIVSITKVRDDESRSEGFTLKEDAKIRIYAFGERSNTRRLMADYGFIMDPKTRTKVWTMDVDRTLHAGGASKNRMVDEVITLPKGSYIVTYNTDDSHSYDDWNSAPPFDTENYGITLMGAGENFKTSIVAKYVEERNKNIIAQIIRARDNFDKEDRFTLDRTTRIRIYALGEGMDRHMYDYGWIEDVKSGNVMWEMTYSMTFHAGGGRKNRMVNTTILLDKGEYKLRYKTDDSHSYGRWNVDPPEDQQYWGITVYREEGPGSPSPSPNPINR